MITKAEVTKWKRDFIAYQGWDTDRARQIQEQESRIIKHWLKKLDLPSYHIIEVGCGNGYVAQLLCEYLEQIEKDFSYEATDIVPECIEKTKDYLKDFKHTKQITTRIVDVYQLEKSYKKNSQQIIISTGFASAAAYKGAVPKVADVLCPGGILICDFINHFSPAVILGSFPKSLSSISRILSLMHNPDSKYYHCGPIGIRSFFDTYGLELVELKPVGILANPLLGMFRKKEKDI